MHKIASLSSQSDWAPGVFRRRRENGSGPSPSPAPQPLTPPLLQLRQLQLLPGVVANTCHADGRLRQEDSKFLAGLGGCDKSLFQGGRAGLGVFGVSAQKRLLGVSQLTYDGLSRCLRDQLRGRGQQGSSL